MKCCGKVDGVPLSNTCTLDNGLTINHIFNLENSRIKQILAFEQNKEGQILSTVLMLMSEEESSAAKAAWTGLTEPENANTLPIKNYFGEEFDYLIKYFDQEWASNTDTACSNTNCFSQQQHDKENGFISYLSY